MNFIEEAVSNLKIIRMEWSSVVEKKGSIFGKKNLLLVLKIRSVRKKRLLYIVNIHVILRC